VIQARPVGSPLFHAVTVEYSEVTKVVQRDPSLEPRRQTGQDLPVEAAERLLGDAPIRVKRPTDATLTSALMSINTGVSGFRGRVRHISARECTPS
jgi:hypothetical protein